MASKGKTAKGTAARVKTQSSVSSDDLTSRDLLSALRALKRGEFDVRLPDGFSGISGQIADTLNGLAEQLESFSGDVQELGVQVGREGKVRKRIPRGRVRHGWAQTIEAVNGLVEDVTGHSAQMARVIQAVSFGDLTQSVPTQIGGEPLRGEFLHYAEVANSMVEQLGRFGSEVSRVAKEVGVNGQLGAQAVVHGAGGTWKELTDNVNQMASNLTDQVRDVAMVTTAVARGDLSKKISVDVKGEVLELKETVNTMVDQLNAFAGEVTRVAREVGTDGILGGQASVLGVSGTWAELTDNVNQMADNLTGQVRDIARVATAVAQGDLSRKVTVEVRGEVAELKGTINTMVDQLNGFASEVTRMAREVGTEGILGGQADVPGAVGVWRDLTDNVNQMGDNLTNQVRNIAEVATAIAGGDLGKKITVEAKGEVQSLKDTINLMVDRLNEFSSEVTRVARLVGTEGTLGVQAEVKGVAGTWKELTDNVNFMANNLTTQVRNIAEVTTAVAKGDLSRKITVEVRGEVLALKNTINEMVDSLNEFSSEVTRMAREVGTEGVLGGQADVPGAAGVWRDLTNNVNSMANNLTGQVRNISEVATAIAAGDLGKKVTVNAQGEVLELKETVNIMVDQLNSFGAEVTRLARDVGVEGKLGGQAEVPGVRGLWKDLTENVNLMASNLTDQVRDIAQVASAVASGDLARKIAVDARGEIQDLKVTINTMVDQLNSFSTEVTRLSHEVGVEGRLGGQAEVRGVAGVWRELTDNVNLMARNLTDQVRNVSEVATAIAEGNLKPRIVVEASGEIAELKTTINTMVSQLGLFSDEVTRVAREVGTEGKLGGQAQVHGAAGTWRDLTDNVNQMATNLTSQVRDIAEVTTAVAKGDLTRKITVEVSGEILQLKNTINTMVDQLSSFAVEVTRVARDVGVEGRLGGQAEVRGVSGTWRELTDNVNLLASNLTSQVRDIAVVTTAVATGDLSRKITVEVSGEILDLKNTINTMVDQLRSFAGEVTRVASEVGTEGVLGGQAHVRGVAGTWRELTDNVNTMALNLTEQVRGIASVVTAVAEGDLKQSLTLQASGEIAELAETINGMTDTLSTFADQVTGVAHDVGVEGRLGGQAQVPGASGIWRDLTDNVNELASNLTTQVRAIGDVATAVTNGDLTATVSVSARGEVAILKDNINRMIQSLAETTANNNDQDWLKTNLASFTRMLQGQRDLLVVSKQVIDGLCSVVSAQHGVLYMAERSEEGEMRLSLLASYAYKERKNVATSFKLGEGLVGQCALEKESILITNPPSDYIRISSGLGDAPPANIVVLPIVYEDEIKAVIELASLQRLTDNQRRFLEQLAESLGVVLAGIQAQVRTDELLRESQRLTEELQTQQEELQQTNEELEEKARELGVQKEEVELKNIQVEEAKVDLEEKAEQLALTSRYKSEFLANMSHELRTPLNSLLILSQQLASNSTGNLNEKQVEFAKTIYGSGNDLLHLINEVLDLAKVESGTMGIEVEDVDLRSVVSQVERSFREVADDQGLGFDTELEDGLMAFRSDGRRLQQILRNLLSNAFKFTHEGSVKLKIVRADGTQARSNRKLMEAESVIAFTVIDTGIGIPVDKQRLIFEAFQQAEGSSNRVYGGTGLGLSISREICSLLGGELSVESKVDVGSVFTLLLPIDVTDQAIDGPAVQREAVPLQALPRPSSKKPTVLIDDDRDSMESSDRKLLVVEDDPTFAAIIRDQARERGFKVVVSAEGQAAQAIAETMQPDAITLDLELPDVHGWVVLDRLKHHPATRHIPVHVVSADENSSRGLAFGAIATLQKPVDQGTMTEILDRIEEVATGKPRHLLVIEDDKVQRDSICELIGNGDVLTTAVENAEEALVALEARTFDCIVLDLKLPGMDGFELIEKVKESQGHRRVPIIVYTGRELGEDEENRLNQLAETVIVKGVKSPERLLDETALFLHRVEGDLPEAKQQMLRELRQSDPTLKDKQILIVDDDPRNLFATTSMLETHGIVVSQAESGSDALDMLKANKGIDLVLMDIMMPGMDGYEAIGRIRKRKSLESLPIIALTAKAMLGDRERCIAAGASDYITKPLDADQLLSLLRVWLAS